MFLELSGVRKNIHGTTLLDGVDLRLGVDDRTALVGPNGSGKSTLLRILAGLEEPDEGRIVRPKDLRLGFLEQNPALPEDRSIRDVVSASFGDRDAVLRELEELHVQLGEEADPDRLESLLRRQTRLEEQLEASGGHEVEYRVESTLAHLGLRDPEARCGVLSGGEQRRVALAQLLLTPWDLWLLDEPTNHLDALAIDWLEDFLLSSRTPFLLVTHDRYFLDRVVTRILELDRGRLHESEGGYGDYLVAKAARDEKERHDETVRQNLLRRETAWMRRGPPARTTKAKARIDRYHDLVDSAPVEGPGELSFRIPPGPRLGTKVLHLRDVGHAFGDQRLFQHVDVEVEPGMRLGIIGANGAGKSTLMNIARGTLEPDEGEVVVGDTVVRTAISQKREDLDPEDTVLEAVAMDRKALRFGDRDMKIETFLDQFLFTGERKRAKVANLSGGERQRVLLARLLSAGANVLFLDEPTNDLDLMTLRVLEDALLDFPGSAVVVSHDRWFLDRVATHVLWFEDGEVGLHVGDVSSLLERRAKERAAAEAAAAPRPAPAPKPPEKARSDKKWSSKERNEFRELPAKIEAAETELATVDERLSDPSLYQGKGDEARKLAKRREELGEEIQKLYARWEELEERAP